MLVVLTCFAAGAGAEIGKRQTSTALWGIAPKGAVAPAPAALKMMQAAGINALVVDSRRAGEGRVDAMRRVARAAGMSLVVLVPEASGDASLCRAGSVRCAELAGSLPAAKRMATAGDRTRPLVAVRVSKPSLLDRLASARPVRRPILVIVPLYKAFNETLWNHVLATAAASPALDLVVAPLTGTESSSVQSFGAALAASGANGEAQRAPKPCSAKPHGRCTDVTAPTAPAVVLVGVTASAATVSWQPSVDDVGVAGYRTYVGSTMQDAAAQSPETVGGLTCGVPVSIAVAAVDAAGNVSPPSSVTATPGPCVTQAPPTADTEPPSTPTGVAAAGIGETSVTLSWNASVDNVGVTGYRLFRDGTRAGTASSRSYAFGGLACGTSYTLGVAALDAAGNVSGAATTIVATAPCPDTTAPSAPTGLATSAVGQTSATLSWSASSDDVGVTGYRLFRGGTQVGTASGTSYAFGGLSCGTTYALGVAAVDAAGNVSQAATTSVTTAACGGGDVTPPSTPTGLATSAVGQTSATLSWSASSDDVGVTGYRLFRGGTQVGTASGTSYAFGGLACGTSYTLGVAALDAAGNVSGTATATVATAACPDTTAPSIPTGLVTSAVGQTSATLSWSASSDDVGVTGYRLFRGGAQVGAASGTSYVFGGLACGTSYTLGVAALDAAGNVSGTATRAVSTTACPDTTAPSIPTGLATSAVGQTSATLSWSASSDDVGVTGYRLFRGGTQVGTAAGTSYAFGGLSCGTSYSLGVAAVDAAGNVSGTATRAVSTTSCPDTSAPSIPTALATSAVTQTAVTLSWTASIDNVGVTGYRMFRNGSQVATWLAPGYVFGGLACGTSYTLGVAAVDAAGNVSATASTTATTAGCADTTAPSTPSGLTLTGATQTSATLAWSASADNVGVAGYRVFVGGAQAGTTATTSYGATGLVCGQTYTFGVAAFDAAGNASAQTTISAATAACGGGIANLFVASSGSDTTCSRAASPLSYALAGGHVCASFDRACHLASGGDTVIVEDGQYAGQNLSDCTGLSSTVTFRTEPGHECPYSAATPYNQLPAQSSDTSCKVKIDGELNMSASKTGSPVNSPLKNLAFVGMYANDLKTTWAHNITFSHMATEFFIILGSDGITVQDSDIGNSFDGTCSITAMAETQSGGSVAQPTNIKILRNIFHDEIRLSSSQGHPDGLFIYEMDGGVIDGNVMYRAGVIGIYMNLVEWSPLYGLGKINNVQITNNVIHDIVDMTNTDGPTHSVSQSTLAPQNISLGDNDISNVTVAFNSVSGWIRRQDRTAAGGGGTGSTSNLKIYGNVAGGVVYGNNFGCPAGATVDYNLLYDGSAVKCGAHDVKGPNPFTAPDTWSSAGSYFTVTPGNFSTKAGSPALDLVPSSFCSTNACPATDFNGTARPRGTAYDAGAYENS
jgi:chitodextrinase